MVEKWKIESSTIPVEGGSVRYWVYHDKAQASWRKMMKSPLLCLHGGPGDPHGYLLGLADLADERPVIFYDQLGCGQSDRPDDTALWTVDRFVRELQTLVDDLKLTSYYLLGHSWGAILAAEHAFTRPPGLRALLFASAPHKMSLWLADLARYRRALPLVIQRTLDYHEQMGTTDSAEYTMATFEFYRRHLCRLDPWPSVLLESADTAGLSTYRTMWGVNEFNMTGSLRDYDCTPKLSEIRLPSLFLCGRYDEAPPKTSAFYASIVKDEVGRPSPVIVFEESAHLPMVEEPVRFRDAVRSFLARIDSQER